MFIRSTFGPDRRISQFEVWISNDSEVMLSFLSRQKKLTKWGVIIFWPLKSFCLDKRASWHLPRHCPRHCSLRLELDGKVCIICNRIDCKCECVQVCVRLVLDSKMTPVQTAHQTLGSCGLTSVTVFSRIPLWIVPLMDMCTIWRNCG